MIVAGLQKLSLVDFPGQLAAVVFLQGCNFRCGYCHNPALIKAEKIFDLEEKDIFEFLDQRRDKIDAVVISGGEPAIHPGLPEFIRKVSAYGLKVKLDTNGSVPSMIEKLFKEGLIEHIALDIKTSLSKYRLLTEQSDIARAITESIRIIMSGPVPYEFRTTCVPGVVDKEDFTSIGEMTRGARAYFLQQFRPGDTYDEAFSGVEPFTPQTLRGFADILKGYVQHVDIRGI
jgi:pyruvate formate lyase activating enzyme